MTLVGIFHGQAVAGEGIVRILSENLGEQFNTVHKQLFVIAFKLRKRDYYTQIATGCIRARGEFRMLATLLMTEYNGGSLQTS